MTTQDLEVAVTIKHLKEDPVRITASRYDRVRITESWEESVIRLSVFNHIEKLREWYWNKNYVLEEPLDLEIDVEYRKCKAHIRRQEGESYIVNGTKVSERTAWGMTIEELYSDDTRNTLIIDPKYDSVYQAIDDALVTIDNDLWDHAIKSYFVQGEANHE